MITGMTIDELQAKVDEQRRAKLDLGGDTRYMTYERDNGDRFLGVKTGPEEIMRFPMTRHARNQVAHTWGIPTKFWDRLEAEAPQTEVDLVNSLFREVPKTRMIRTLDNQARAFLSGSYRRMDNDEMMDAVVKPLRERQMDFADIGFPIEVRSADLTERHLHVQFYLPNQRIELTPGRHEFLKEPIIAAAGIALRNSEIGVGGITAEYMIWHLRCWNGYMVAEMLRKTHLQGARDYGDDMEWEALTENTRALTNEAMWAGLRDQVRHMLRDDSWLRKEEQRILASAQDKVPEDVKPMEFAKVLQQERRLTDQERDMFAEEYIKANDRSRWGVVNAMTAMAHKTTDYDRAVEYEQEGGYIQSLPQNQWGRWIERAERESQKATTVAV